MCLGTGKVEAGTVGGDAEKGRTSERSTQGYCFISLKSHCIYCSVKVLHYKGHGLTFPPVRGYAFLGFSKGNIISKSNWNTKIKLASIYSDYGQCREALYLNGGKIVLGF